MCRLLSGRQVQGCGKLGEEKAGKGYGAMAGRGLELGNGA